MKLLKPARMIPDLVPLAAIRLFQAPDTVLVEQGLNLGVGVVVTFHGKHRHK